VVEGFASRVAAGDVPPSLRDVSVLTLDLGLLQAGASMKGEFEQRLRNVIDEVQASPRPIVLFIDEIHTLVGAGGAAGTGDAANLLKPALARGTLRTIGATTWSEYKKYIEKDPALTRRFQVIQIDEPSEEKAIAMLRGIASYMEEHHRVLVLDQAVETAVRLSHRYIPARQLPDKAVSLLDTACARVSLTQHATPPHVETIARRIETLELEASVLRREAALGMVNTEKANAIEQQLMALGEELGAAKARWEAEKKLIDRLLALRIKLQPDAAFAPKAKKQPDTKNDDVAADEPNTTDTSALTQSGKADTLTPEERVACLAELAQVQRELEAVQGENPLVLPSVNDQAVAAVVSDWTGIPVGRMVKDEISSVLSLADTLNKRVIGQRHSLDMIAERVQISRARLDDPVKPVGVFMLVGPSGVGKTETAQALAEILYGGEQNVITINMSEFQEAHTVSTLKGAPPGYVGYGEGGVLTEAVRRKPYSVVLLDEIEKAHPDVHEIFFQVFDKGSMEDGEGRHIDFKNTIIILTSNVGSDLLMSLCRDPDLSPGPEALAQAMREPLLKVFPAAFLGRLGVIPYYPLGPEMLSQIVQLKLTRIKNRILANHKADFTWDQPAIDVILSRATEIESGGRMIDAILANGVLPRISKEYLERALRGSTMKTVHMSARAGEIDLSFS
jgi:type VI secretion system protein VasG